MREKRYKQLGVILGVSYSRWLQNRYDIDKITFNEIAGFLLEQYNIAISPDMIRTDYIYLVGLPCGRRRKEYDSKN